MLRSAVMALAFGLALSLPGGVRDSSFREAMVPVHLANDGGRILYVSQFEVTAGSWAMCHAKGGCSHMPKRANTDLRLPVTDVNWFDVKEYLAWANRRAGGGLRLPTADEWQDLAHSVVLPLPPPAYTDPRLEWAANYGREKAPSGPVRPPGSFSKSDDGVYDLDGNVWEWTSSCFRPGISDDDCPAFLAEGEHTATMSVFVRDPALGGCAIGVPPAHLGLRLVSDH